MKTIILLLLIPSLSLGQFVPKIRPMVIPKRDSANSMQYAINSMVFNNGVTEMINLFNVRNGNWLSIPQDTFMLGKYRNRNDGSVDTILHIRYGNVKASPKSQLSIAASQITGLFPYSQLSGTPAIPTSFPWASVTGRPDVSDSVKYYSSSGRVNQIIRTWVTRVAVTAASGFSVDISGSGFSTVLGISALAERNTASASSVPNVAVKSFTNSAVVLNFTEASANLINVALINLTVVGGAPIVFANTTGLFVHLTVTGY